MIVEILNYDSNSLKHAITSLISVISSTLKGVEYLTTGSNMVIVEKIIKVRPPFSLLIPQILKAQQDGSVT